MLGTRFLGSDLTSLYIRSYQFGKATSFDKDRDSGWIGGGCSEYSNSYETGFKAGGELENTDDSCELTIQGKKDTALIIHIIQLLLNSIG